MYGMMVEVVLSSHVGFFVVVVLWLTNSLACSILSTFDS